MLLRCNASPSTCCTIIALAVPSCLHKKSVGKFSEMALKKKWIQRYQKIGGFVNLRQLHHSGMLDDRWKPLAIGKTGECDLKSKDWRPAIPLRCIPCSSPRWSDWWFLDTSRAKAKSGKSFGPRGKIGSTGAILGLCGDLHRSIEMHCHALHQLGQEFRSRTPADAIQHHCQSPKSIAYISWIMTFVYTYAHMY